MFKIDGHHGLYGCRRVMFVNEVVGFWCKRRFFSRDFTDEDSTSNETGHFKKHGEGHPQTNVALGLREYFQET